MEESRRILRRSVHAFLQDYQAFASTAALLVFPASAATLLSQALAPPSAPLLAAIRARLAALFVAGGFPPSSELFSYLNLKFSQTIFSFAFTFPFALTFLVLAKATVIQLVVRGGDSRRGGGPSPPVSSLLRLYVPMLQTHLCNALVVLAANAAAFALLFVAFNAAGALGVASEGAVLCLSGLGAVVYSVVLANALVTCSMAVVVTGVEGRGGCLPLLKACMLVRGRAATGLSLALPTNLFMAAAEALFQVRVVLPYRATGRLAASVAWEGAVIAYMYSMLIVLDIIVSCMFFRSCTLRARSSDWAVGCNHACGVAGEEEDAAADGSALTRSKLQDQP